MHIYINAEYIHSGEIQIFNAVEKSRTARSDKNTNSCPKTFNKTVTGYIFYHTVKYYKQTRKLEKSILLCPR